MNLKNTIFPQVIQGGMGVGVSGWRLARAVSMTGQLGVVSGTALDVVLARELQLGDPDGNLRHALDAFPFPEIAERVLKRFYIPEGKDAVAAFRNTPVHNAESPHSLLELTIVAAFAQIFLAKEGHENPVGLNLLEKIQIPTLPSLFGAMLAGVDYVLMGAGIPRQIPGILDKFSEGQAAELKLDVAGAAPDDPVVTKLNPADFCGNPPPVLKRPRFLAIVSSAVLALNLKRKASGNIDGFVVEGATAGGHNAPPRGPMQLTDAGEPVYGPKDLPDLEKFRELGLPFWLAGGYGRPGKLQEALKQGAAGIQVGTAFAFCRESGLTPELKTSVLRQVREGKLRVFTDPCASPTGFPFKLVQLSGTLSDEKLSQERPRLCDLGFLRHLYRRENGSIGYRCPSEPIHDYIRKGGVADETRNRKCICNGLLASIGLGQARGPGNVELPVVTAGDDAALLSQFLPDGQESYSAAEVVNRLLADSAQADPRKTEPYIIHTAAPQSA
ncbi:MAG: nitronate monooxygenase [Methylacidiphilales bacterium]|nr:nitronate monooxygenase [Candidatus Methylacidiphilales bacterium]